MEILKQPQYKPLSVERQIIILYAVTNKYLRNVAVDKIYDFEIELYKYIDTNAPEIITELNKTKTLSDELENKLKDTLNKFLKVFEG